MAIIRQHLTCVVKIEETPLQTSTRMTGLRPAALLILLVVSGLLSACGQKGPLTLPLPTQTPATEPAAKSPAPAPSHGDTKQTQP
ncbi:MAG TPA: lipoprotein [Pseudomonadales bacterium]|nr:lipoprotein [Pseudomonadales bacterium]